MTGLALNATWARAYHTQALSDFHAYELLEQSALPRCHALQHLQMASEKVAKAYRLAGDSALDPGDLHHHAVIRAFFRAFLRQHEVLKRWQVSGYAVGPERLRVEVVAATVEALAPAVDKYGQPRNAEYPWSTAQGSVVAPVDEAFHDLGPTSRDLLRFLTVLRLALQEFDELAD